MQFANEMIATIQLNIIPGPTLAVSTLERFAALAAASGKTADELLAEAITREVESHSPQPEPLKKSA